MNRKLSATISVTAVALALGVSGLHAQAQAPATGDTPQLSALQPLMQTPLNDALPAVDFAIPMSVSLSLPQSLELPNPDASTILAGIDRGIAAAEAYRTAVIQSATGPSR